MKLFLNSTTLYNLASINHQPLNTSLKLEVIAFDIESCIAIENAGAHRIELCDSPADGGTTASYGFIKKARAKTNIELYPIIRPRGGDFFYSDDEFDIMKADVMHCKNMGCDGIVIGILTDDGNVDKEKCRQLIQLAYPLGVTFHRAFDRVNNASQALEDIIDIGCERILTSGLQPNAMGGMQQISSLIKQADERIIIMPGSGVRSTNIAEIAKYTNAKEFHTSARMVIGSSMEYTNPNMKENLQSVSVNADEIKLTLKALQEISQV
jgi:copper homeostasis protein